VLVLVTALASGIAGASFGRIAGEGSAETEGAPPDDTRDLSRQVGMLAAEVDALGQAIGRMSLVPESRESTTPTGTPHPLLAVPDLQAQVAALTAAVERLAAQSAGTGRAPLSVPVADPERRKRVESLADTSDLMWPQHAFWTCQQVLDAYGMPDDMRRLDDGTEQWAYISPAGGHVNFFLSDGRAISANAYTRR